MKKRVKKKASKKRGTKIQHCTRCGKQGHNARSHKRGSVKGLK